MQVHSSQAVTEDQISVNFIDTRAFVEEAIVAYEGGLYRSCVVFSWVGSVSLLYDHVINNFPVTATT